VPQETKRRYDMTKRGERARQTRQRIAHAARPLFEAKGYASTTIQAIAGSAGVAVDTVFEVWGSKAALFEGLIVEIEQTGSSAPLLARLRATSPKEHPAELLRLVAALARDLATRLFWATEAMRRGGLADPQVAKLWANGDARRRADMRRLVVALKKAGKLKAGLSPGDATTVLWSLTSPDLYRMLVAESRWSVKRYETWLGDSLIGQLLG
jgi:TetR/AcrR family transcriptional regulator, regulator of cefoperazone and chloramphenicol sensitivity